MSQFLEVTEKTFTRQELVKAQMLVNKDILYNPKDYDEITQCPKCAEKQIDILITRIKRI